VVCTHAHADHFDYDAIPVFADYGEVWSLPWSCEEEGSGLHFAAGSALMVGSWSG
jgi:L-ascorbate metabolism protein UlaG (beta-lactamase superfamily)